MFLLDTGNMVMSGNVIALRKVFMDVLRSSTNGSFTGNFSEPLSRECSRMWKTPVLSSGMVLKMMENSLLSIPLSIQQISVPVLS